jgi:hypothetical protein
MGLPRIFVMAALALILPMAALADPLVPAKRLQIWDNTDLPKGDLASIFDTDLNACERACLNNARCEALVFNTRNNSCFLKAGKLSPQPFDGAYAGFVVKADPAAEKLAQDRAKDLTFLQSWDLADATALAADLANRHTTNGYSAADHLASAHDSENAGDYDSAYRFAGAATVVSDSADDWMEYARLLLAAADRDSSNAYSLRHSALSAAVNAYLRSGAKPQRHSILVVMGQALEAVDQGRIEVQALRLAQQIQPRDDTEAMLDDAIAKYGFRIIGNDVVADSARPQICANFSEALDPAVDYGAFVQLPEAGMSVALDGDSRLCVEGVQHGARYTVTFREGLPAADGQSLAKSIPVTQYIRDRSPGVRFAGRGYVLPRIGEARLPVTTVNTKALDLTVFRVSDRNMLRAIQNGYFAMPVYDYEEYDFENQIGAQIWSGSATVAETVNQDVTSRLNLSDALKGAPAGVYALKAAVPGLDPNQYPPAWQWFTVSDLGLTTFWGVDGLNVVVRSLGDASARPGVEVQLLSATNEVLGTAATDDQGLAHFDAGLTRGTGGAAPALVVAKAGTGDEQDLAFLSLADPEFDLSDRGVEGREPAGPIDVFLTTDRGAYRAGETVHALALARDGEAAAVEGMPLTAILKRPDGVEYYRALADDAGAGGHVFDLPIQATAPRGTWSMEVYADLNAQPVASQTFLVEDFLPERIDFKMALPKDQPIHLGDVPKLTLNARYLFGAPGADLAVEGEVLLRQASTVKGFDGYLWGKEGQPFQAQTASFEPTVTDAKGKAVIDAALPEVQDPMRPLEARFTVRIAEGSGRPVERRIVQPVTPSVPLIGVKPLFQDVVPENGAAEFQVLGLGTDQAPMAMQVHWKVTRIETQYQWYQTNGDWNWEPVTTRTPVAEGDAALGKDPTMISAPVTWGEYELAVDRSDGTAGGVSTTFWAGWYAPADVTTTPDTLELSLDKPAYRPGETAMLRVVPRAAGTALVSVLSNRLITMKAVAVKEGENLIPMPVTDDWGAGVYVTASVLRPMDVAAGRNPARALGLAYAAIDPGTRQLKATLQVPAEAAPRGPLDVAVKVDGVQPGDTAYVTLAAVDQGILNLTAFDPPDPSNHYFGQRKLGVGIRDLYGRLIDGLTGAEGQVRSGGDAGAQARLKGPVPTEELLAFFTGPLTVGADGLAHASFDLPSFNGQVKVMAVAWSKTGVGQANADVLVRDPVVVTASLPRFLTPGDTSRLLLEIVHASGPSGRMGLDVTASPGLTLGSVASGLDLADQGKARVEIPITAGAPGDNVIEVALTTPDGKVLKKTLHLTVEVTDPQVVRVTRFDLAQGKSFTFDDNAFAGMMPGTGRATLAIGPIARLNAPGVLQALDVYPYGCTEQITSKAMPLLYFEQVAQAMEMPDAANIHERVGQAITEVLLNQGSSGGFSLWYPDSGDMWLDAYVTDFLSRAKARGYDVPDTAFRMALDNLRNQVNYYSDFDVGGEPLAYALMVLAREGAAAIGDLRYYADVKGDAFATPLAMAQLGAALASYGDQPRADAMFRRAVAAVKAETDASQVWRADYGTAWRDAAGLLSLGLEAGSTAVDRDQLVPILAKRTGTMSTQEMAWGLLAANALIDRQATDSILLDGAPATGPLVKMRAQGSGAPVTVQNTGPDTTLTVTTYGVPDVPEPAGGNGYAITRTWYTLDGQQADLSKVKVGDRLVAVLDVTPFAQGEARLMVTDPLPAGFEIDNPNLISSGSLSALDWLSAETDVAHSEFRSDRFLTAIDRHDNASFELAYIVRAISPGTYHAAAPSVEDMYRPDFSAHGDAGTITIQP